MTVFINEAAAAVASQINQSIDIVHGYDSLEPASSKTIVKGEVVVVLSDRLG